LILPYTTYRWYQIWRRLRTVYKKRHPKIEPDVLDLVKA
jgi:hypothetical protein